jgi:nucleotide-binding universal stress UspA family protein
MFQRILVPLDGSPRAEQALPVAARIARATGGTIILLRATPIPIQYGPYMYGSYPSSAPVFSREILDADLARAQYYLAAAAQSEHLVGIRTETKAIAGPAAHTILTIARLQHVDLIVMCTRGLTGLKRWVLGSVAHKVLRHSTIPVLVLPVRQSEPTYLQGDAVRALVALDGSSLAETALVPAAQLVAALSAPGHGSLHLTRVVNVSPVESEHADMQNDSDAREHAVLEARAYLAGVEDEVRNKLAGAFGLKVTWSVTQHEDVADALIRMAELGEDIGSFDMQGCDLIAMTTHGRKGLERWMVGSITERVLDGTHLPLFVVPMPQEAKGAATSEPSREEVEAR